MEVRLSTLSVPGLADASMDRALRKSFYSLVVSCPSYLIPHPAQELTERKPQRGTNTVKSNAKNQ